MKKETIAKVMSHLGARGTGQSKVRGDSKYYSRISRMRKKYSPKAQTPAKRKTA